MAEQRYQAVLAVIADGLSVSQVAEKVGVSRQTLHTWLARFEVAGLDGLVDRSHRPAACPHQMPAVVEPLLELLRSRPYWGPRRLVFELAKRRVSPVPSESAAYRALLRAGMIDPSLRDQRSRKWKRWEIRSAQCHMGLWRRRLRASDWKQSSRSLPDLRSTQANLCVDCRCPSKRFLRMNPVSYHLAPTEQPYTPTRCGMTRQVGSSRQVRTRRSPEGCRCC